MENPIARKLNEKSDQILATRKLLKDKKVRIRDIDNHYWVEIETVYAEELLTQYIKIKQAEIEIILTDFKAKFLTNVTG